MNIAVFGTGYVGLAQGACLASLGHSVTCVDIDREKVVALNEGRIPIYEAGLAELVREARNKDLIRFTTDAVTALDCLPEVIFVCVQTPRTEDGHCDISFVETVVKTIADYAKQKTLVVIKSTVPPGIKTILEARISSDKIEYASNPEFLRAGKAVKDFLNPDRIVIGVESPWAEERLRILHRGIDAPVMAMSIASAQLSKYAANTMLAARLSFMNEIANIADVVGADIQDVEKVVGSDDRIGSKFLRSGAGFGGSCFPKDVLALHYAGVENGYDSLLISPVIEVNDGQPVRFVDKIVAKLGDLNGKELAVWGLAFNAHTDDIRESPAVKIVHQLIDAGAQIHVYDPKAMMNAKNEFGDRIAYARTKEEVFPAHALLVLTEWPEFDLDDWQLVKQQIKTPYIFDAKNFLNRKRMKEAGLVMVGMGICEQGN